jgi:hypothetical protein
VTNTSDITLDTASSGGPPSPKLNAPGASITVGIVNVDDYQQRDLGSGELLTWDDGKPKMGKVVTGLVITSSDTTVGKDGDERPATAGDLVTLWIEKGKHYTWRDAVKAAGGVKLGDVMLWTRGEDKPATKAGFNPQKVYTARIRRSEAKDGDLAERCFAAYQEAKDRPTFEAAPSAPQYTDEEPF